jgi:hypothetical protein
MRACDHEMLVSRLQCRAPRARPPGRRVLPCRSLLQSAFVALAGRGGRPSINPCKPSVELFFRREENGRPVVIDARNERAKASFSGMGGFDVDGCRPGTRARCQGMLPEYKERCREAVSSVSPNRTAGSPHQQSAQDAAFLTGGTAPSLQNVRLHMVDS